MKFAIFCVLNRPGGTSAADLTAQVIEQAEAADDLGYEAIWIAEHHFTDYSIVVHPAILGAAIAARTKRLRIGSGIVVLPFHDPKRLAEDYAFLDVISNGRFDFGFGRGYQPAEFQAFGIPMEEARGRVEEALDVIEGLWRTDNFSYDGEFYRCENLTLEPKPVQANIPMWMAAVSPESFELAGKAGRQILAAPQITPMAKIKQGYSIYREALTAAGHDAFDIVLPLQRNVYCHSDPAQAVEDPREGFMWFQHKNAERMWSAKNPGGSAYDFYQKAQKNLQAIDYETMVETGSLMFNTPEKLVEQIAYLRDELGVNYLVNWMHYGDLGQDRVLASMELFAKEVMPHFAD